MKNLLSTLSTVAFLVSPMTGQELLPKWNVEIPVPIADGTPSQPAAKPEPVEFTVLTSRTTRMTREEAPPMAGLPPVTGVVNVTVQKVADPGLPDPPPPLPALPPDDPAVIARLEALRQTYRGTEMAFVSASVFDERRTLLRIYPNGKMDETITAWSNLNFLHFSGFAAYRVNFADGTFQDYGLLMGVSPIDTGRMRRFAAKARRDYEAPEIPQSLPDLAVSGPAFIVVDGDTGSSAMDILEQAHDLYRKEGSRMELAYHAREKERAEKFAYFSANPPKPKDITIRFWRRSNPAAPQSEQE